MNRPRLWAPDLDAVEVDVGGRRHPMSPATGRAGWWTADVDLSHGDDYAFVVGPDALPDPRAPWLPNGAHRPGRAYDHSRFRWTDQGWAGRPLRGAVLYELHVGTFTPGGTFDAAISRLGHLVDLGVTHVELLPVATFDGTAGWGYDGVGLYAVHEPYGGPDGCKRFVDACHARGLAVIFDVVYNHLGPSGNYLPRFGPYFTDRYGTPWGDAVNLDGPGSDEVRRFFIDNALGWCRHYHADGLRLDAVHEMHDERAETLLEELGAAVAHAAHELGRPIPVIAESDRNDPRTVRARPDGGLGLDAQWDDDVHHGFHALLTGEQQGYYCDFGSVATLAKALADVFVHDGTWSTFRQRHHGRPVASTVPAERFVVCLQNHDQVGNRAVGDRLADLVDDRRCQVGAALLLAGPFTPLLFMGEEWGARTPWQFFTSFPDPELGAAVRNGRRAEFASHGWASAAIPDPQSVDTFERSKLDWEEASSDRGQRMLGWYRRLIALRREQPALTDGRVTANDIVYDDRRGWLAMRRGPLQVSVNLGTATATVPMHAEATGTPRILVANDDSIRIDGASVALPANSVAVTGPATDRGS